MPINKQAYQELLTELEGKATLVAVSKVQPIASITDMYALGQRDFGENYVQELVDKQSKLPADIRWHFIGHLQSNKVKYIAPFVHLVHGVDSFKLLQEINKQAAKNNRIIHCLLQIHIASEETKFGLDSNELEQVVDSLRSPDNRLTNIHIDGLMGMASFSEDTEKVKSEFQQLKAMYDKYASVKIPNLHFSTLSMGMSGDYRLAISQGSNMVRIGSLLFGARIYS